MSIQACAEIVAKGDPDRFRVIMSLPVPQREKLFPLFAFNVEVSRAPWMTTEPMIAEMRLQWWRDAIEEIRSGSIVRNHEVTIPLALIVREAGIDAAALDRLVAARRWDIYSDPFEDRGHFEAYLEETHGALYEASALAVGGSDSELKIASFHGKWSGLANFLRAAPELKRLGRQPWVSGDDEAFVSLSRTGLREMSKTGRSRNKHLAVIRRLGILTVPTLRRAVRGPECIWSNGLVFSEFEKRFRLLLS